jgi:tetratricopeptide (TPR) repeat protein
MPQAASFDGAALLRDFEQTWQTGAAPSINAVVQQLATQKVDPRFLEELVQIDLKYRWKNKPSHATDELPPTPLLEDYVRCYPSLGSLQTLSPQLIGEEYRARQLWGDRPDPEAYLARFPSQVPQLTGLLASIDAVPLTEDQDTTVRTSRPVEGFSARGYEVLGELGRGGMGVVYKARQLRLNRLVAIKTISSGLGASAEELARFRAEAELAARIQHPNIVQVYEVGEQDGQPFCILEYVNGSSLSRKLAGTPLEPRAAGRLLETLARAVQAVHDQGILHRDLKPANVLLHLAHPEDADRPLAELLRSPGCVPKVSDFGLARRIESSELTPTGAILGTPGYMAPEQASARSDLIGPSADVYGLGAILYELLTGRPPFRGVNVLETLAQVRSQDPVPPRSLQPAVPRDLETICLECLQKKPGKRYGSAGALADDLERFRLHQPIQARPTRWWERAGKWMQRRPALATLAGALLLGIVIALAGGLTYTLHLRAARAETERQRQQAGRSYRKALESVEQMLVHMGAERIDAIPGTEKAQVEALTDAIRLYQELLDEQQQPDPDLDTRLAFALTSLAGRQMTLGQPDEAQSSCRRAIELLNSLPDERADTAACRQQRAMAHYHLGNILAYRDHRPEAERAYRAGCDLLEGQRDDASARFILNLCYTGLGALGSEGSRAYFRQALELCEELVQQDANSLSYRTALAQSLFNVGHSHLYADSLAQAEALFERCRRLMEPLAGRGSGGNGDAGNRKLAQVILLHCYVGLGMVWAKRGETDRAEAIYQQAAVLGEQVLYLYPQPGARQELAQCYQNLGALYQTKQRRKDAEQVYRRAIALGEELVRELPDVPHYRQTLGQVCANMALILPSWPPEEPLTILQKGREALQPLLRAYPGDPAFAKDYGNLCNHQALVLLHRGQARQALPWHDRAVEVVRDAHRRHPGHAERRPSR